MHKEDISVYVLAGGRSRRMQQNKAELLYNNKTFLENVISEMKNNFNVLLSHNKNETYEKYNVQKVVDLYEDIGPIGGLYSILKSSKTNNNFIVSCDTPNVTCNFVRHLYSYVSSDVDAIVPVDRKGKIFPTVAIYNKSILPKIKKQIDDGNYKLMNLLKEIKTKYVYLDFTIFPDETLSNVNTVEEYKKFIKKNKEPVVLAISGIKNSGKTTLITKLIPKLNDFGFKVATIKHDGHDFDCDVEGTDTFKHFNAGAIGTSIFSKNKFFVLKNETVDETYLKQYFNDVDIILLEGFKHSNYKKIEVVRKGVSQEPICNKDTLLAIASNCITSYEGVTVVDLDDEISLCEIIKEFVHM